MNTRPTRAELWKAIESYGAATYSDADEPDEAAQAKLVIDAFIDAAAEPPPVIIEFPAHDLQPGGYDGDWPRCCPRCHELPSSVRSSEFGIEPDGTWLAGHYKRGPCGRCRSQPPLIFAVLAPDGRLACATLVENAVAKIRNPDWAGAVLVEYAPQRAPTVEQALAREYERSRRGGR